MSMNNHLTQSAGIMLTASVLLGLIGCSPAEQPTAPCTDALGCVRIAPGEAVRIGVLQTLSGAIGPLGQAQLRGLELALESRGATIAGHPIELQVEDTGCTAEGGANGVLRLIADPQIVAIYGTTCSSAAATASQAMSAAGLTMISGNNSAPFLTSLGGKAAPDFHAGYFRTANNEEQAGRVAAEFAFNRLGLRKAAAIHDNDIYTMGLASIFQSVFEELGGKMVFYGAINKGDQDMTPILDAVAANDAELIFFPLFAPEGKQILLQARNLNALAQTRLMSDGALIQQSFLDEVGEAARGMYFVGPAKPHGEAVLALEKAYIRKYGEPPAVSYYITGHDAAILLLSALEKTAISNADGSLLIGRQQLRTTLYSTTGLTGASGDITCNHFGDCGRQAFDILRLDDPGRGLKGLEANVIYSNEPTRQPIGQPPR